MINMCVNCTRALCHRGERERFKIHLQTIRSPQHSFIRANENNYVKQCDREISENNKLGQLSSRRAAGNKKLHRQFRVAVAGIVSKCSPRALLHCAISFDVPRSRGCHNTTTSHYS